MAEATAGAVEVKVSPARLENRLDEAERGARMLEGELNAVIAQLQALSKKEIEVPIALLEKADAVQIGVEQVRRDLEDLSAKLLSLSQTS